MELWIWMLIVNRIIAATCPFTSKIGSILSIVNFIAVPVFCILCFFYATSWWYGLVAWAIYLFTVLFIPKINPNETGVLFRIYSGIFSHLNILIVVLMYLSLFKVI